MNPPSSLEKKGVGVLWVGVRGGRGVSGWGRAGCTVERATPPPPPTHPLVHGAETKTHELCPVKLFCDGHFHL